MIVSTTLTGSNEKIIADALLSVIDQVDACLLIDTGIKDNTIAVAHEVAGDKLLYRRFPWVNDFSAARNYALQSAAKLGADWALTLDSDERLHFAPGFSMPDLLHAEDRCNVIHAYHDNQKYMKERLVHLNRGVHWVGTTHECVNEQADERRAVTLNITFTELPKSDEQARTKNLRDEKLLRRYLKDHDEPRWHMYYGLTLHSLHRPEEAIPALLRCIELGGYLGEGSLAMLKLTQCYVALKRFDEAKALCERAIEAHPEEGHFQFLLHTTQARAVA